MNKEKYIDIPVTLRISDNSTFVKFTGIRVNQNKNGAVENIEKKDRQMSVLELRSLAVPPVIDISLE